MRHGPRSLIPHWPVRWLLLIHQPVTDLDCCDTFVYPHDHDDDAKLVRLRTAIQRYTRRTRLCQGLSSSFAEREREDKQVVDPLLLPCPSVCLSAPLPFPSVSLSFAVPYLLAFSSNSLIVVALHLRFLLSVCLSFVSFSQSLGPTQSLIYVSYKPNPLPDIIVFRALHLQFQLSFSIILRFHNCCVLLQFGLIWMCTV